MNQTEFNFLVTNVTAISTQLFSIRCSMFGSEMSADESNEMETVEFDLQKEHENFDYQSILDSGYRDINSLETELSSAMLILDQNELDDLLNKLPSNLPNLQQKMTGEQLKAWISYALNSEDDESVALLNQYIMSLFQVDDEIHDLIREAIAFDKIDDLQDQQEDINSEHIKIEDLLTAAEIESFRAFKWLFERAELDNTQIIELLFSEKCIDDQIVFESVYKIIEPSEELHTMVTAKVKGSGHDTVAEFLDSVGFLDNNETA